MPTCPTCHSEFVRNGRQKHCSSKCRSKAGNAAKTARNRVKREGVSVAAPAHPAVKLPSPGKPVPCPLCARPRRRAKRGAATGGLRVTTVGG